MARIMGARNRAPYEELATRILHQAVLDSFRPGLLRFFALAFLLSPGAADWAEQLGYDPDSYRRGVARLLEGQDENQATANGGAAQLQAQDRR